MNVHKCPFCLSVYINPILQVQSFFNAFPITSYVAAAMALSAAERARRYRENRDADPERRQKWLAYQREKNKRDKERGKKKLVKDMTKREHRYMKKVWRKDKARYRQNKKNAERDSPTPSTSRQRRQSIEKMKTEKEEFKKQLQSVKEQLESQKKKNGNVQEKTLKIKTSGRYTKSKSRDAFAK